MDRHNARAYVATPSQLPIPDWHDAVTALVEADAYWALFPELVGPAASAQQPPHQQP